MTQYNNSPAVVPSNMRQLVAAVPEEYALALANLFGPAMTDLGSAFRMIKFKGFQFQLKDGNSVTISQDSYLPGVILGMAHDRHLVYFANQYSQDMDDAEPQAVWYEKAGPVPGSVPANIMEKRPDGHNNYQIRQRIVFALLKKDMNTGGSYLDVENPYAVDISAMSLYGADIPTQGAYSLSGLLRFCTANRILPCNFMTSIVFNNQDRSVPNVRFVPAMQDGSLAFLDAGSMNRIYAAAASPTVASLLAVRLIPDPNAVQSEETPQATPMAQPQVAPPAPMAPPAQVVPPQATPPQTAPAQPVTPPQQVDATATPDLISAALQASQAANSLVSGVPQQAAPRQAAPTTADALAGDLATLLGSATAGTPPTA